MFRETNEQILIGYGKAGAHKVLYGKWERAKPEGLAKLEINDIKGFQITTRHDWKRSITMIHFFGIQDYSINTSFTIPRFRKAVVADQASGALSAGRPPLRVSPVVDVGQLRQAASRGCPLRRRRPVGQRCPESPRSALRCDRRRS